MVELTAFKISKDILILANQFCDCLDEYKAFKNIYTKYNNIKILILFLINESYKFIGDL